MNYNKQAITITFGDRAENHVGMQQIGELSDCGFNYDDLLNFKSYFDLNSTPPMITIKRKKIKNLNNIGDNIDDNNTNVNNIDDISSVNDNINNNIDDNINDDINNNINGDNISSVNDDINNNISTNLYNLKELAGLSNLQEVPDAYVLIIRGGVNYLLNEYNNSNKYDLFQEQLNLPYDKKAFMKGRVVNKHARWNICFSNFSQKPNYENKMGTIINFDEVPLTNYIKNKFEEITNSKLQGEGNYYYDTDKTGIGFHGDSERKKIIAVKLGEIIPFEYQWYFENEPVGERIHLQSGDGDIYMMDEIASGFNWKKRKIYTLRHAVGCKKYTT